MMRTQLGDNVKKISMVGKIGLFAFGLAIAPALVSTCYAQSNSIFPDDMDAAQKKRFFMRLGYIHIDPKTDSGEAYDVTGPVLPAGELRGYATSGRLAGLEDRDGTPFTLAAAALDGTNGFGRPALAGTSYALGLGTPGGIKSKAGSAGTPALSLGYYLNDELTWVVEAFVLGVPMDLKAYGDGLNANGQPVGIAGKHVVTTKLLPPTAIFGRYFGDKENSLRPFLGVGATYAVFFDTKATDFLNYYQGGTNPGDTTVSLKNGFGLGVYAGIQYRLTENIHVSLNVGHQKLKTEATIVTKNTMIRSEADLPAGIPSVVKDYPQIVQSMIFLPSGVERVNITDLMTQVAAFRQADGKVAAGGGLGTYTRKQKLDFANTVIMLTVGYDF